MRYTVGQKTAFYSVVLKTQQEKDVYLGHEDKIQFEAYSVGNELGQAAIFPIDDFGKKQALEHAVAFCNLLNSKNVR